MHKMLKKGKAASLAAFVMAVLLFLGMTSVPVYAEETSGLMKITSAPAAVKKGESVSVDLRLSGNPGIWGIQFEVDYDHSVLSLESVTAGDVFAKGEVVLPEADDVKSLNEKGQSYTFVAAGADDSNNSSNGTLATLKFTVKDTAEKSDAGLLIRSVKAYQADEQKIADNKITVFAGTITVSDAPDSENPKDDTDTPGTNDEKKDNKKDNKKDDNGSGNAAAGGTGGSDKGNTNSGNTKNTSAKASKDKADTPDTSDQVKVAGAIVSVLLLLGGGGLLVYYRLVLVPRRRRHSR